ncbi:hypothetical protein PoB_003573700 [Plakobranchus ocellatus]|uniref:Uncharacterized protein n=1 Tax=Plakobranchus ocellatus TaxID=259542 RepID=A0AAV4APL1_9GAST|nr:hypothetical protein PoB_003573700 [Plakobranchus ocellatus]
MVPYSVDRTVGGLWRGHEDGLQQYHRTESTAELSQLQTLAAALAGIQEIQGPASFFNSVSLRYVAFTLQQDVPPGLQDILVGRTRSFRSSFSQPSFHPDFLGASQATQNSVDIIIMYTHLITTLSTLPFKQNPPWPSGCDNHTLHTVYCLKRFRRSFTGAQTNRKLQNSNSLRMCTTRTTKLKLVKKSQTYTIPPSKGILT